MKRNLLASTALVAALFTASPSSAMNLEQALGLANELITKVTRTFQTQNEEGYNVDSIKIGTDMSQVEGGTLNYGGNTQYVEMKGVKIPAKMTEGKLPDFSKYGDDFGAVAEYSNLTIPEALDKISANVSGESKAMLDKISTLLANGEIKTGYLTTGEMVVDGQYGSMIEKLVAENAELRNGVVDTIASFVASDDINKDTWVAVGNLGVDEMVSVLSQIGTGVEGGIKGDTGFSDALGAVNTNASNAPLNINVKTVEMNDGNLTIKNGVTMNAGKVDITGGNIKIAEGTNANKDFVNTLNVTETLNISGESTLLTVENGAKLALGGKDLNVVNGAKVENNGTVTILEGSTLNLGNDEDASVEITSEGSVSGSGSFVFKPNTTLKLTTDNIIGNTIISEGTSVILKVKEKALNDKFFDFKDIFTVDEGKVANLELKNTYFSFTKALDSDTKYEISEKTSSEISDSMKVSEPAKAALLGIYYGGTDSDNTEFNKVATLLKDAAEVQEWDTAEEASNLGADVAPVVRVVETARSNMIFAAANDELNNAEGAMATSRAGDYFRKVKAWIRGLANYADKDGTSKAAGFDVDTYGVAMGIDKELDNHSKAGFGYAYSQADVDGHMRDTDVDSHTLFVYGQYKPADWYINTALAYSWSDYDEKKSVLGYNADAKYDVETIALQSMYGLEHQFGAYNLNPEFGFRYMHISQDGYTDNLGSNIKSKDSDVLTAVVGTKVSKAYALESGTVLRPELKAAVTYDIVSDNNNANVMLANGAGYRVNGEKLERLGLELGAKVAAEITDNWELAAGYEFRLRKDYNDNTLMLNAQYNF